MLLRGQRVRFTIPIPNQPVSPKTRAKSDRSHHSSTRIRHWRFQILLDWISGWERPHLKPSEQCLAQLLLVKTSSLQQRKLVTQKECFCTGSKLWVQHRVPVLRSTCNSRKMEIQIVPRKVTRACEKSKGVPSNTLARFVQANNAIMSHPQNTVSLVIKNLVRSNVLKLGSK